MKKKTYLYLLFVTCILNDSHFNFKQEKLSNDIGTRKAIEADKTGREREREIKKAQK